MATAEVPFDLAEAKLAAPAVRPGTVAKADLIARLCAASMPFATIVAPAGTARRRSLRGGLRLIRVSSRGSRSTGETTTTP